MGEAAELLLAWVERQAPEDGRRWLHESLALIQSGDGKDLAPAFALAPRRVGRTALRLSPREQAAGQETRPGWRPNLWSVDLAARALLLLAIPDWDRAAYVAAVNSLFRTAEVGEYTALLRALPLLPHGSHFVPRACEGVRSNADPLLQAIAFDNPYPAERFNDDQWNGMVLKCLFLDLPVERIVGLETRMNRQLGRMVSDLLSERAAANRLPPPGAGRFVVPPPAPPIEG